MKSIKDKKNKNYLLLLVIFLLTSLGVLYFLNYALESVSYKKTRKVSKSIQESKKNGVFIREYQITDIEVFDTPYQFPFDQVWKEMYWHSELGKKRKEVIVIDSTFSHTLVFMMKKDISFCSRDSVEEMWIMWSNVTRMGVSGFGTTETMYMTISQEYEDSTKLSSFTIYKQKSKYDYKNDLTPLFKFNLTRDNY